MSQRLLVLGGTEFVGRAFVEEALAGGWSVDVFNRGSHQPLPGTRSLIGDRTSASGLAALFSGEWDVVVDTWSWAPYAVRDAAELLRQRAGQYVYVSSRSVYRIPENQAENQAGNQAETNAKNRDAAEDAPIVDANPDDIVDDDYARSKAGGEMAAVNAFGDRALLLRAGLILGPHENVGRLPWWLNRIAAGGRTLAPGPKDAGLQYIDARDIASWALPAAAGGLGGPFDTVSQPNHTTMIELLDNCRRVTGSDARWCWRDPETIIGAGIEPWVELPIWLPPGQIYERLHQADVSKASQAGLVCRPIADTVDDTWQWLKSIGGQSPSRPDRPARWLSREKEHALIQ